VKSAEELGETLGEALGVGREGMLPTIVGLDDWELTGEADDGHSKEVGEAVAGIPPMRVMVGDIPP